MPYRARVLHAAVCAGTGASAYLHNCPCLVVTVARISAAPLETARQKMGGEKEEHKKQQHETRTEESKEQADNKMK